ncbi:MAG: XRE family transcriptional regulator [Caulobacter sp.]|nr:XRE family transcriptional regulator [Caulobacter sp.]
MTNAKQKLIEPRGLNREQAATYIGVSPTKFDQLVADGRMPRPKAIDRRNVWDRASVDRAFESLPGDDDHNPWDEEP